MYQKPDLQRFGTLRELTLLGFGGDGWDDDDDGTAATRS